MIGSDSLENFKALMAYDKAGREERDYSFIASMRFEKMLGKCVYCNHCLPCPSNIDIARVHKYLDLAQVGDELARQHYLALEHKATDCIECGTCEDNCPFQVSVRDSMKTAIRLFGC